MAKKQIFYWSDFSGGEGDGLMRGHKGSYRVGENVDNKTVDGALRVSNKATELCSYVGNIAAVSPYSSLTFATNNSGTGKLYKAGTYKMDTAGGQPIFGFGQLKKASDSTVYQYGIGVSSAGVGGVWRIATDFLSLTSIGTFAGNVNANYPCFTLSFGNGDGSFVFAHSNGIYSVSDTEVITRVVTLGENERIVGFTKFQDSYRVYYNRGENGVVAVWDGLDTRLSNEAEYVNSPIIGVSSGGAYDYATFGSTFSSDLYAVGGVNRKLMRVNVENTQHNSRIFSFATASREGLNYFAGQDKLGNYCVYEWGNYYAGQQNSLTPILSSSSTGYGNYQAKRLSANDTSVIAYYDNGALAGKVFSFDVGLNEWGNAQGVVLSYPVTGASQWTLKRLESLKVAYDLKAAGNSIALYVRTDKSIDYDNTAGWTLVANITDSASKTKHVLSPEIGSLGIGTFNTMEWKAVISVSGTNYSPMLFSAEIEFTDNIIKQ